MKSQILFMITLSFGSLLWSSPKLYDGGFCTYGTVWCVKDAQFIHDQMGRCGCLAKEDYFPLIDCIASLIQCEEPESYSIIKDDSFILGCGCFETEYLLN